jgi:hypothetical protein
MYSAACVRSQLCAGALMQCGRLKQRWRLYSGGYGPLIEVWTADTLRPAYTVWPAYTVCPPTQVWPAYIAWSLIRFS